VRVDADNRKEFKDMSKGAEGALNACDATNGRTLNGIRRDPARWGDIRRMIGDIYGRAIMYLRME